MVRVKVTADVVRARAADVLQDGSYCGLFELTVLAAWKNVKVLVVFGTNVLDVYDFFGKGLPPRPDRPSRPAALVSAPWALPPPPARHADGADGG